MKAKDKAKLICFYLPQFHPIEANNKWWGEGFTDWNNVVISKPRFKTHYQPHLPSDLGFYDLRLTETIEQQVALAKSYKIYGFCFYHYWFNGEILLHRPLENYIKSRNIDFPFCLCWANENWTKIWDGLQHDVLIEQKYSDQDNEKHIEWLLKIFNDERYIKINNCPLIIIYRIDNIPKISDLVDKWKSFVRKNGFNDLYICAIISGHYSVPDKDIMEAGFDAIINFQPNRADLPKNNRNYKTAFYEVLKRWLPNPLYQYIKRNANTAKIYNYDDIVREAISNMSYKYNMFPTVFPSWDNSPRRKTPIIIQNENPEKYGYWLETSIDYVQRYNPDERIVFINAWNEWAEGCHLEPDRKHGHMFLNETMKILERLS